MIYISNSIDTFLQRKLPKFGIVFTKEYIGFIKTKFWNHKIQYYNFNTKITEEKKGMETKVVFYNYFNFNDTKSFSKGIPEPK